MPAVLESGAFGNRTVAMGHEEPGPGWLSWETRPRCSRLGCQARGVVSGDLWNLLFLEEAPEFARDVLDALRQPLESGEVVVARSGVTTRFPARFTLVLAANPCPCAKTAGPADGCSCSPAVRRRYLGRISGPLLDRIDVKVELEPVGRAELLNDRGLAEPSQAVALRVLQARQRAAHRLRGTPWRLNAEIPGSQLRRNWPPAPGALAAVERSLERGLISARGVVKVIRVAWTLADLAGRPRPAGEECDTALGLWLGARR